MTEDAPRARFRFVFNVCNDVAAMRRFYVDILGFEEEAYMDTPEFAYLSVRSDDWEAMWFRADARLPVATEFASQPGWEGGTVEATSWAVWVPEERFGAVREALAAAGASFYHSEPAWRQDSYWGLSVLDPMGVTIELYTVPAERPAQAGGDP
jgi:catechol 2,3-dioxygenase-like lactoylglutathione lyase family enzyme